MYRIYGMKNNSIESRTTYEEHRIFIDINSKVINEQLHTEDNGMNQWKINLNHWDNMKINSEIDQLNYLNLVHEFERLKCINGIKTDVRGLTFNWMGGGGTVSGQ